MFTVDTLKRRSKRKMSGLGPIVVLACIAAAVAGDIMGEMVSLTWSSDPLVYMVYPLIHLPFNALTLYMFTFKIWVTAGYKLN